MSTVKQEEVNRFLVKGKTKLVKGTILAPETGGLRFVLSLANLAGKTEENPMLPIFDKKWKQVRTETRGWYANKTGAYKLGAIHTIAVNSDIWAQILLAQDADLQIDVKALGECLKKVSASAKYEKASVHVSTLLTDKIPELPDLLVKHMVDQGVSVYFYQE